MLYCSSVVLFSSISFKSFINSVEFEPLSQRHGVCPVMVMK